MKKISAFLVGAGLIASSVLAADPVTSVNMVGYVNQDLLSNKFHFSAVQMPTVGGTNQIFGSLIGDQLPSGSWVYFWNSSSQVWVRAQKALPAKGGWGTYSNRAVSVGEGIFILAQTNMMINLSGEVPLAPTSSISLVTGYNALGYMYPVDTAFSNSVLYDGLPAASWLHVWDDNTGWARYQKALPAKGGWGPASNLVFRAGQGFFARISTSGTNLFEARPFTP